MPNLLLITKNYPPEICGVGDHSFHLKKKLEGMGYSCTVLYHRGEANSREFIRVSVFNGNMYQQIKDLIISKKIDTILWQYVPYSYHEKGIPFWWPWTMLRLRRYPIPQFIYFHEVSLRLWGYGFKQGMHAFCQRLIAHASNLLATSSFTSLPLYQSYFPFKKPSIVPVSSNFIPPANPLPVIPYQVFCFTNRADEALIAAIKRLSAQFPVRLVLAGNDSDQHARELDKWLLHHDAGQVVVRAGVLTPEQLAGTISGSAIFFQPQRVEHNQEGGLSAKNGTIVAAMAMGKAIISCKGDMTDETIFKDGLNYLQVAYSSGRQYEAAIKHLFEDALLTAQLGEHAKLTYQKHMSWDKTADTLAGIINPYQYNHQ